MHQYINNEASVNHFAHNSILNSAQNSIKNTNYPLYNPAVAQFNVNEYQQPNPVSGVNSIQLRSLQEARANHYSNRHQTNIGNSNMNVKILFNFNLK